MFTLRSWLGHQKVFVSLIRKPGSIKGNVCFPLSKTWVRLSPCTHIIFVPVIILSCRCGIWKRRWWWWWDRRHNLLSRCAAGLHRHWRTYHLLSRGQSLLLLFHHWVYKKTKVWSVLVYVYLSCFKRTMPCNFAGFCQNFAKNIWPSILCSCTCMKSSQNIKGVNFKWILKWRTKYNKILVHFF